MPPKPDALQTQEEIDVAYWQHELLTAVKQHDAALDLLAFAADQLHEVRARYTEACARRDARLRLSEPTPIAVHPKWRNERSA